MRGKSASVRNWFQKEDFSILYTEGHRNFCQTVTGIMKNLYP